MLPPDEVELVPAVELLVPPLFPTFTPPPLAAPPELVAPLVPSTSSSPLSTLQPDSDAQTTTPETIKNFNAWRMFVLSVTHNMCGHVSHTVSKD